jgi:hypothetical protein
MKWPKHNYGYLEVFCQYEKNCILPIVSFYKMPGFERKKNSVEKKSKPSYYQERKSFEYNWPS